MEIRADEITRILREQLGGFSAEIDVAEVGSVLSVGDGIARIHGLERCMAGELLELPHGVMGLALNLEEDSVGAVLFGESKEIREGDQVKRTKRIMSVPVGDAMVGRVVNALGQPIDGKGPIKTTAFGTVERMAPGVVERQPVKEPLQTGIKAIDAMVPIGRGQRELIIGDRQTGKTAMAIDTIINQKGTGVICIYVAIGQKQSTVAQVVRTLEEFGAMDYTIVVAAVRLRAGAVPVHRPLHGLRDRRVLPRQRQARALHLRRPLQARRVLPRDLAAAAPAAGTRGVPGRRLLPAQPPARARGQAQRQEGRGLAHRAADHRDPGGRPLRLHPDERHLDHRRADLPRVGSVQLRHPSRDQRRQLGLPRRRRGAGEGDEGGRGSAAARPRAVPRDGRLRAVRLRPRQVDPGAAGARPAHDRDPQAGPVPADVGRDADRDHLRGDERLPRPAAGRGLPPLREGAHRLARRAARPRCSRRSRRRRT